MELMYFAIDHGYLEAMVRGQRSSFLKREQYDVLKSATTIDAFKAALEDTDYSDILHNVQPPNITISQITRQLKLKLANEFKYFHGNSSQPLTQFLNFIKIKYMIDNTINIMEGLKNKISFDQLYLNCEPIGYFEEMNRIKTVTDEDMTQLYSEILVDTPIGPYFLRFLEENISVLGQDCTYQDIQNLFKEMDSEQMRGSLKKMWLEDFYCFIEETGSITREIMQDLLKWEADMSTLQIIYNTMDPQFNANDRQTRRERQVPMIGYLYPDYRTNLLECTTLDQLRDELKGKTEYKELLKEVPDPLQEMEMDQNYQKTIDDIMYEWDVKKYSMAFDQQCQFAVFYGYLKLKEQEIRNIQWLAEMIVNKMDRNDNRWKKNAIPFDFYNE